MDTGCTRRLIKLSSHAVSHQSASGNYLKLNHFSCVFTLRTCRLFSRVNTTYVIFARCHTHTHTHIEPLGYNRCVCGTVQNTRLKSWASVGARVRCPRRSSSLRKTSRFFLRFIWVFSFLAENLATRVAASREPTKSFTGTPSGLLASRHSRVARVSLSACRRTHARR